MTFDKQVEKAKQEKLKYRIIKDVVFILLGIVFLAISIFVSFKSKEDDVDKNDNKTKTAITTVDKDKH